MKLYGSFQSRMMESAKQPEPVVGMGCTICMFTDRLAATVTKVLPKTIIVTEDTVTRTDNNGISDSQVYICTPNPNGMQWTFTKRADGSWRERGGTTGLLLGDRRHYYDFGF